MSDFLILKKFLKRYKNFEQAQYNFSFNLQFTQVKQVVNKKIRQIKSMPEFLTKQDIIFFNSYMFSFLQLILFFLNNFGQIEQNKLESYHGFFVLLLIMQSLGYKFNCSSFIYYVLDLEIELLSIFQSPKQIINQNRYSLKQGNFSVIGIELQTMIQHSITELNIIQEYIQFSLLLIIFTQVSKGLLYFKHMSIAFMMILICNLN
ncbi:unnamed protein product (macronuclear) [Paramecium tetraurelia]|uniref:Chromosome undetermined scaffold_130, whole genome shotgun sequence n=1 Tax=Paramecium tetraurelia TaxID=5888 RepID=A0BVY7_PARTE|nr:uncharacterized protein GSPATT00032556001 [Paramecium tetraurelia]XP_001439897.1 uncharacterized protein GSPATT00038769001 [Paramecium tetraurelia]CAK62704.1 unnamed protein product [Paramecium tetraurelia]CAK72500.1 unnamed protein product [Paramecium tetraurelia]|eukprot:XP_001430102.1 hypothetical protein (macronuclear) [Paramecium tetraurelia strain d4-2]